MDVGDNLSYYPHLEFLSANGPEELREQLLQIRIPYKIISVYSSGEKHYAWISPSRKLRKIKQGDK